MHFWGAISMRPNYPQTIFLVISFLRKSSM